MPNAARVPVAVDANDRGNTLTSSPPSVFGVQRLAAQR